MAAKDGQNDGARGGRGGGGGSESGASSSGSGSGSGSGSDETTRRKSNASRQFWIGLARGFGGAVLFSLPMYYTMENWWLGFYLSRTRLVIFLLAMLPLFVALSNFLGMKPTEGWLDATLDAVTEYGVGLVAATGVLLLIAVLEVAMPPREIVGKIAILAVPGALGASLARSQLGASRRERDQKEREEERKARRSPYRAQMLFMGAGAFYVGLTVAPTEEMILIAYKMSSWHAAGLAAVSLMVMHAFVYALRFKGTDPVRAGLPWWNPFLRFTVPGYLVALLASAWLLWTFDRFESVTPHWVLMESVVLGFPAAIGAAAARIIF